MTAGPSTNPDWMHHETILPGPGDGDRRCGNCDKTDGLVYTSNPPMRKCTITGKFHLYNDVCDAPQTNADRIRSMTDDELAEFIGGIYTLERDAWGDYDPCVVVESEKIRDKEEMLEWLQSPAGGDGDDM